MCYKLICAYVLCVHMCYVCICVILIVSSFKYNNVYVYICVMCAYVLYWLWVVLSIIMSMCAYVLLSILIVSSFKYNYEYVCICVMLMLIVTWSLFININLYWYDSKFTYKNKVFTTKHDKPILPFKSIIFSLETTHKSQSTST
jgi:hypothetical protein